MKRGFYMAGYTCPFCQHDMSISDSTYSKRLPSFENDEGAYRVNSKNYIDKSTLQVNFYKCPHCDKTSITLNGVGFETKSINMFIHPNSNAKQYPDYITISIRQDYEEACSIVNLSPKASATLSRRCLQGMIRDFWGISKPRLIDEINELQGKIHPTLWKVIDSTRRIGNIGAHMEKDINLIVDIDPDEAQKLIKLIELLIKDWYIQRHEQETLYADIIDIDTDKQSQRK